MDNSVLHENIRLQMECYPERDCVLVTPDEYARLVNDQSLKYSPSQSYGHSAPRGFMQLMYKDKKVIVCPK